MNPASDLQPQTETPTEAATETLTEEQPQQSQTPPSDRSEEETEQQPPAERNTRFRDILKPEVLNNVHAMVVGVGAIGRQLALQLAAVGVKHLWFIDPDTVEIENLGAQGFLEEDMGAPKVDAVALMCHRINGEVDTKTSQTKFRKEFVDGITSIEGDDPEVDAQLRYAIFSCVDDMKARKQIWTAFSEKFITEEFGFDPRTLFMDARMGAEAARTLAVSSMDGKDYYPRTLFEARDGLQQSCTAKTTIYCANLAAAMMMGQFSKWCRGMLIDKDILYNIFAADFIRDSEELV